MAVTILPSSVFAPCELNTVSALVDVRALLIRFAVRIFEYAVASTVLPTSRKSQ